jgi:hypothetical protein
VLRSTGAGRGGGVGAAVGVGAAAFAIMGEQLIANRAAAKTTLRPTTPVRLLNST